MSNTRSRALLATRSPLTLALALALSSPAIASDPAIETAAVADPAITAELARWGRSAVPFNLAYPAGGADVEPRALPEVLTPDIVLRALQAPPER